MASACCWCSPDPDAPLAPLSYCSCREQINCDLIREDGAFSKPLREAERGTKEHFIPLGCRQAPCPQGSHSCPMSTQNKLLSAKELELPSAGCAGWLPCWGSQSEASGTGTIASPRAWTKKPLGTAQQYGILVHQRAREGHTRAQRKPGFQASNDVFHSVLFAFLFLAHASPQTE